MSGTFSERHGYRVADAEIAVREDAPDDLRYAILQIARQAGMRPSEMRDVVCGVLLVQPNSNNWSNYPNIWNEVQTLVADCPWFKVYDIAEALWRDLPSDNAALFQTELNSFFRARGIGWELKEDEGIVFRGGETFTAVTEEAVAVLAQTGRATASGEVREALKDISRKPPDTTGAMQHAMAALECVARDVSGNANATLGALLAGLDLPKPLDTAVEKLWGFASNRARHVQEGNIIGDDEAEVTVTVACAVCIFLARRTIE